MDQLRVVGLDLAKNVFQVHMADETGRKLVSRQLKRKQVLEYFGNLPPSLVGMEACGGAHEWARRIEALGHTVKMMPPQYVKPYVQGNKTDARDAAAICEAAGRASVPRVAIRSRESQQLQALHRVRERWMKQRTAIGNQMRGLLGEFGEVIGQGYRRLREAVGDWLGRADNELAVLRSLIESLLSELSELEERIALLEGRLRQQHRDNPACRLIESIPGVGLLTATAAVASYGRCEGFTRPRQFSCALGLTPREHSSGDKQVRLGISKRGNRYLRKLLVQGAQAVLKVRMNRPECAEDWAVKLAKRRGRNVAAVALAAKNARRICAMLHSGERFRPDYAPQPEVCGA